MEEKMKARSKSLLVVLLVVVFLQLSCSVTESIDARSERERDRDRCLENGGIWHDVPPWCEMPQNPTPTGEGAALAGSPVTPTSGQSCDAYSLVSIQAVLNKDGPSVTGARNCDYTLMITNNSDQRLVVALYYVVHNPLYPDDPVMNVPHWGYQSLGPGDSKELNGHGADFLPNTDYAGDHITWYMDQIAITYASCHEKWLSEDPSLAEVTPYIRTAPYYCSP